MGYTTIPLECDNFVFRKVNWPLPLRSSGWVGFSLMSKLLLSVMKTNCWCSLSSNYILLFHGFEIHHSVVSFSKNFQIFVQCATWFKFAVSISIPFLFGKILISNKLCQLYWNIVISVQIFGILSLLKM